MSNKNLHYEERVENNVSDLYLDFKKSIEKSKNKIISESEEKINEIRSSKEEQKRIINEVQGKIDKLFDGRNSPDGLSQIIFELDEDKYIEIMTNYFNSFFLLSINSSIDFFKSEILGDLDEYLNGDSCNYKNKETEQFEYKIVLGDEFNLGFFENSTKDDFNYYIPYSFSVGGKAFGKNKDEIILEDDSYAKFQEKVPDSKKHIEKEIVEKAIRETFESSKEDIMSQMQNQLDSIEKELINFLNEINS